jgi:hypothetical protein
VSAHVSPSDRKPALQSAIAASVFNKSRVDRVAGVELVEYATKLCALGLDPARHFAEHLARPVLPQIRDLSGDALPVGRYPRIAVNHGFILHRNCATEKPNPVKGLILVQNF